MAIKTKVREGATVKELEKLINDAVGSIERKGGRIVDIGHSMALAIQPETDYSYAKEKKLYSAAIVYEVAND